MKLSWLSLFSGLEVGDFVSNSLAGVGDVGWVDKVSTEEDNERKTEDLFGAEFEEIKKFDEVGIKEINHCESAETESRDTAEADAPVEIKEFGTVVPPSEMFESLEIPAGKIFEQATT